MYDKEAYMLKMLITKIYSAYITIHCIWNSYTNCNLYMTDPNELCSLTRAILLVNADCATAWNTRCVYMCINMFNHAWHALHLYKKKIVSFNRKQY